ncbi:dihydrodipicolinate synthase family protein [Acidiphilium iwatense]|uniref:Dihydrodipicolinate synthase family protein n=1 Tax=Acidiphilium iwatense TaxID=768198 RepID=A0ABS9E129_9PROT|nr:dihydrodipicolinate synthase family protein [Acidiphilium iwatense]MCF3948643.1 dihydrodipicolinate synthase family protein [Acidiphilium iwatense]
MATSWHGILPATTTQFAPDMSLDLRATQRVQDDLINDGIDGLVVLGTVGENNSLDTDEKLRVLEATCEAVAGRVPVIAGISEFDARRAADSARAAEKVGVDGLMLLPPMVYVPRTEELIVHFKTVASASSLPIMLYNNPPAYRINIGVEVLEAVSHIETIVAIKESVPDSRRFTDLHNSFGNRFEIFAGLDDLAFEGLLLGACGWVSGLTNAFPRESVRLVAAIRAGDLDEARKIYRWFMPLLHLDAEHDLVQSIKLAEQMMGRGSERVRLPRLTLTGERRAEVIEMVRRAAVTSPLGRQDVEQVIPA